jgi:type IV pilus assembly protein PilM
MAATDKLKEVLGRFRIKARDAIGVDLGSTSIKIVQLRGGPGRWSLARPPQFFALPNAGPETAGPERREQAIRILKDYVAKNKTTLPKSAVFSVSGNSVIVRYVKFPKMSREDLSKTIQFEAEPHIPFSMQEVNLGFHILGDVVEDGQKKMETVLVAAKQELIEGRLDVIQQAGLAPVVIDVDAFSLEGAYEINRNPAARETVLLVHIGASVTTMTIIEGDSSKVVRDVFIAGNSLTKAIQRNFQLDTKQAEEKKAQAQLLVTPEEREKYMTEGNKSVLQMSTVLLPVMKDLLAEVQRLLDFYLSQGSDRQVARVLLSGGGARLGNLINYFSQELRLPVEMFDPFAQIEGAKAVPADMRPLFSVAVGLAIRRDGDTD